jgi:hypothetical protein
LPLTPCRLLMTPYSRLHSKCCDFQNQIAFPLYSWISGPVDLI